MKTLYLLILLLLQVSPAWSGEDTTRAYCGECIQDYNMLYAVSTITYGVYNGNYYYAGECEPLPVNCHWECIKGDLYRICKTEDGKFTMPIDSLDTLYIYSNPTYDTITVCDTTWRLVNSRWFPDSDKKIAYYNVKILCRDTVVEVMLMN